MVQAYSVVRRRRRRCLTCQKPRRWRCGWCKWTTSSCIVVVTPHALRPLVMYILYLFKIHNNNIIIYSASKQPNLWARLRLALVMGKDVEGTRKLRFFSFIVFLTHDRNPLHCPWTINRCGKVYIYICIPSFLFPFEIISLSTYLAFIYICVCVYVF